MSKFAIYTAFIGGYEIVRQPITVDERFDYILFTNDLKVDRIGVWKVLPIYYSNTEKTRIARYVKTHPEELLPGYDATLWMDMNLQIVDSYVYERFVDLYESNAQIAGIQHPERDCIYVEAFTMSNRRWEHDNVAFAWCHKLRKEGYPFNWGLYESGILFRRKSNVMTKVNEMWWDCISTYSKRDQFSINYVLWKLGVKEEYFFAPGVNPRYTGHVNYYSHAAKRKLEKTGILEYFRIKTRIIFPSIMQKQWNTFCAIPFPKLVLPIWGIIVGALGIPYFAYLIFKYRILRVF